MNLVYSCIFKQFARLKKSGGTLTNLGDCLFGIVVHRCAVRA
jgi:hypothetical protein